MTEYGNKSDEFHLNRRRSVQENMPPNSYIETPPPYTLPHPPTPNRQPNDKQRFHGARGQMQQIKRKRRAKASLNLPPRTECDQSPPQRTRRDASTLDEHPLQVPVTHRVALHAANRQVRAAHRSVVSVEDERQPPRCLHARQAVAEARTAGSTVGPNPPSFWDRVHEPKRVESTREATFFEHGVLPHVHSLMLVKHCEVRRQHECLVSVHMQTHSRRRPWRRPAPPPSATAWASRRHATRHSATSLTAYHPNRIISDTKNAHRNQNCAHLVCISEHTQQRRLRTAFAYYSLNVAYLPDMGRGMKKQVIPPTSRTRSANRATGGPDISPTG